MNARLALAVAFVVMIRADLVAAQGVFDSINRDAATRFSNALAEGQVVSSPFRVDGGKLLSSSRTITIESTDTAYFPQIAVSLGRPNGQTQVLHTTGKSVTYTLPERDGYYMLYLQALAQNGQPLTPQFQSSVELDTTPPVVVIESPVDRSTTDQGFAHLKATIFDPDPKDPTKPGLARLIALWINGERDWNLHEQKLDIPQFPVQDGPNTIRVVAMDGASNRTEAVIHLNVDFSKAKKAPVLSDITLHPDKSGKVILPDYPVVFVTGQLDNPMAIVEVSVNGEEPVRMRVLVDERTHSTAVFSRMIGLHEGENTIVLSAIDGAGNANDYRFIVVRSNRYRFRIASPNVLDTYYPSPRIFEGYVSALRDAGTKSEAHVTAVFVNDIPTILGPKDANGNVPFRTTKPVPFVLDGFLGPLHTRIRWSDGEEY